MRSDAVVPSSPYRTLTWRAVSSTLLTYAIAVSSGRGDETAYMAATWNGCVQYGHSTVGAPSNMRLMLMNASGRPI